MAGSHLTHRYANIVQHLPDLVFILSNGRVTYVNATGVALLRAQDASQIVGHAVLDFFITADHPTLQSLLDDLSREATATRACAATLLASDGSQLPVTIAAAAYHTDGHWVIQWTVRDHSQSQPAQSQLGVNESLLRMASAVGHMGGWAVDIPSMVLTWSDEVRAIHAAPPGFTPSVEDGIAFYAPEYRDLITQAFTACMREGTPYDLELQIMTLTGKRVWVRTIGEAVRAPDGTIFRVQGAFQDISEFRQIASQLQQKDLLLRIAGRVAQIGGWAVEPPDNRVYWSDEVCAILDYPAGFVPPLDEALALYLPESRHRITAALTACLEDGTPFDLELKIRTAHGRRIWVRCVGEAEREDTGAVRRAHGAFQDITAHKHAEHEAARLSQRLTNMLESITDAFITLDPEWRFTYVNREAEKLLNRSRHELLGKRVWDEFAPAVSTTFYDQYHRAVRERITVSFEEYYAPLQRWFTVRAYPSADGLAVYFQDYTEQRAAREALTTSEERFRHIARITNDAIWDWDIPAEKVWWNEGLTTLFGYPRDESSQHVSSWTDHIHPDDRAWVVNSIFAAMQQPGDAWQAEYRYLRSDGSVAQVFDRAWIIRNTEGVAVRMVGGMLDLTEGKETERRLREQAALLDQAQDAIIVRNLEHRITYWNRAAARIYGWQAEEVSGQVIADLLYADKTRFFEATALVLRDGEWAGELEHRDRNGQSVMVEARWTLLRDEDGAPAAILAINTDVTQRKRLEAHFLRAQRLESIGVLAGGIAHDLNNILTPILLTTFLLKQTVDEPQARARLDVLEENAQRAAEMVRQVLTFARGAEVQRMPVAIDQIVLAVTKLMQDTLGKDIRVVAHFPEQPWPIEGDPTQLHQVLVNLCVNARDAMPNGGRLDISVENVVLDQHSSSIQSHIERAGPYVCLSVADNGAGIPPDVRERIFDPFFTTKETGKGTGLGLSTALGIVQGHGGHINVYSEVGHGTVFRIYLPAQESASKLAASRADQPLARGANQLILVVDDELAVRTMTRQTLETFGYRVLMAENGADAVALYIEHYNEIALVLTDMMMPTMDGIATIQALLRINPDVRIVAASGLAADGMIAKATGAGVKHFLPKPYSASAMLTVLAQVLAS